VIGASRGDITILRNVNNKVGRKAEGFAWSENRITKREANVGVKWNSSDSPGYFMERESELSGTNQATKNHLGGG
jgi:hypothetical protein